jgi:hypothetical protein
MRSVVATLALPERLADGQYRRGRLRVVHGVARASSAETPPSTRREERGGRPRLEANWGQNDRLWRRAARAPAATGVWLVVTPDNISSWPTRGPNADATIGSTMRSQAAPGRRCAGGRWCCCSRHPRHLPTRVDGRSPTRKATAQPATNIGPCARVDNSMRMTAALAGKARFRSGTGSATLSQFPLFSHRRFGSTMRFPNGDWDLECPQRDSSPLALLLQMRRSRPSGHTRWGTDVGTGRRGPPSVPSRMMLTASSLAMGRR